MTRLELDSLLRQAVVLGSLVVLLVPAARGHGTWLGWWPLWLVGMPLSAWWSLRGFPLPALAGVLRRTTRRAVRPQARRVAPGARARRLPRAA